MGNTLAEKLISKAVGQNEVKPGQIVSASVDRLLFNDYVGALVFSKLEEIGAQSVKNPEKVFIAIDHNIPAFNVDAADKYVMLHEKAKQYGIEQISNLGSHGIGHQLMVERYAKPLEFCVGTDSHATMYSGVGAFSCGITASDAISILLTGKLWVRVPESIRIYVKGSLKQGVAAKDLALRIISLLPEKDFTYTAVEIVGPAIEELSVEGRLTLANLIAEAGAKCAVFEADEKSWAYANVPAGKKLTADPDANYLMELVVDADALEPLLSCPHAVVNVHPLCENTGIHVDQVFIGSCTNGRMEDLRQAAEILKGKKVAEGTRLLVTPASQQIYRQALKEGIIEILCDAGATILPSSCASCAGHGPGLIGRGEVCLSTTNRNFKGRMGSTEAVIYLGSAYAAAAAAVSGSITDPREFL